ncbi:MAG: GNAT family N-acetyltransferase [Muribaculaceae bacterium]|nr:GNAT family N-acetyltransferase [Muribaculaceae bacterium]
MDIKTEMMKLWKETFHDSDEYISLLFDRYYSGDNVAYIREGETLKAALMAIPYDFSSNYGKLPAVYLCGLSTRPEYRRQGLMSTLMKEILGRAQNVGKAIAFLIPANSGLIDYYRDRGWSEAIYRVTEHYTPLHDFLKENENVNSGQSDVFTRIEYLKSHVLSDENIGFSNLVAEYLKKHETSFDFPVLSHDSKMTDTILRENDLSGGEVVVAENSEGSLCGVLFALPSYEKDELDVRYILADSTQVESELLQHLHESNPGKSITVRRFPELTERRALWKPIYGASIPEAQTVTGFGEAERVYDVANNAEIYGMAKILDMQAVLSFLAKKQSTGKSEKSHQISSVSELHEKLPHITEQQIQAVILRHPSGNKMITELFGLNRLALNMALLLD